MIDKGKLETGKLPYNACKDAEIIEKGLQYIEAVKGKKGEKNKKKREKNNEKNQFDFLTHRSIITLIQELCFALFEE